MKKIIIAYTSLGSAGLRYKLFGTKNHPGSTELLLLMLVFRSEAMLEK